MRELRPAVEESEGCRGSSGPLAGNFLWAACQWTAEENPLIGSIRVKVLRSVWTVSFRLSCPTASFAGMTEVATQALVLAMRDGVWARGARHERASKGSRGVARNM